jgi:hypothetical protein
MDHWYDRPLDQRAKVGGEVGLNGKFYHTGELMPFYVPRANMPQVNEDDYPALIHFAASLGVDHLDDFVPCKDLKVHQKVDHKKVQHMVADPLLLKKRCLVSADSYVLDGNHRYWAHWKAGTVVPVIRFLLPFEAAIKFLFKFPRTYYYGDGRHNAIQN